MMNMLNKHLNKSPLILVLFSGILLSHYCSGQLSEKPLQAFTLSGKLVNIKDVDYININYKVDEVTYSENAYIKNGKYFFRGEITSPQEISLRMFFKNKTNENTSDENSIPQKIKYVNLFIQPGNMQVASVDSFSNLTVSGAKWNDDYFEYKKISDTYSQLVLDLSKDFPEYGEGLTQERRMEFQKRNLEMQDYVKGKLYDPFIRSYANSPIALLALKHVSIIEKNPEKINEYIQLIPEEYRDSEDGRFIANKITGLRNTQIGNTAIGFSLPDSTQKLISLSEFRGKYLLLDFTKSPSGCPPCKEELPFLSAAYTKYMEKGFEILSIDLVTKKYLNVSLKDFKRYKEIIWPVVFDFIDDGMGNMVFTKYGVQSTPTMFLLDPEGKIIAKEWELRGSTLDKTLSKFIQ